MPRPPLVDFSSLDATRVLYGPDRIRALNPQRHEFELLSGVLRYADDDDLCVGFVDLTTDAFWTRGHLPGRPIFPGVLFIEALAQLGTFFWGMRAKPPAGSFFGFGGVREAKFRGVVAPPCRLVIAARCVAMRSRAAQWEGQAFAEGAMVFEGKITGVVV